MISHAKAKRRVEDSAILKVHVRIAKGSYISHRILIKITGKYKIKTHYFLDYLHS